MSNSGFPTSPSGAFCEASAMADKLGKSIIGLCELADVSPSPVYRWRKNLRSYDVSIFGKLRGAFEKAQKRKAKKKADK